MSESDSETGGIRDEDLPEDLQPSEENPLAEPLDEDVDRDDLDVQGGKTPEESDDEDSDEDKDEDGASDDDD
ncbi:MAG: hypothetical protein ACRDO4_07200 [Nocardioides sp.]